MTLEMRKWVKDGDTDKIKQQIFTGLWYIDDPVDNFSKHTLLHDAVVFERVELFEFLLL